MTCAGLRGDGFGGAAIAGVGFGRVRCARRFFSSSAARGDANLAGSFVLASFLGLELKASVPGSGSESSSGWVGSDAREASRRTPQKRPLVVLGLLDSALSSSTTLGLAH